MSDTIVHQDTLDKAAFDKGGKLPYAPPSKGDLGDVPYLTNVPDSLKGVFEHAQCLAWEAALKWERSSKDSLSSKRLEEYRKLVE